MSNAKFLNPLVVRLPYVGFSGLHERRDDFEGLFKRLITIYKPFYAFVANDRDEQWSRRYWEEGKPTFVHWMNYYDKTTAEEIGLEAVESIKGIEELGEG
jgi:hypothetical protein